MGRDPYLLRRTRSAGRSSAILAYGFLAGNPVVFFLKAGCPAKKNLVNPHDRPVYKILSNMGQRWANIWENLSKWLD